MLELTVISIGFILTMLSIIIIVPISAETNSKKPLLVFVIIWALLIVCLWPTTVEVTEKNYELVTIAPYDGFTLQSKSTIIYKDVNGDIKTLTLFTDNIDYVIDNSTTNRLTITNTHDASLTGITMDSQTCKVSIQVG